MVELKCIHCGKTLYRDKHNDRPSCFDCKRARVTANSNRLYEDKVIAKRGRLYYKD